MAADYVFVREYDGRTTDVVIVKGVEDMKVRESWSDYSLRPLSVDENAAVLTSSDEVVVKLSSLILTGEGAENYNLTTKEIYAIVSSENVASLDGLSPLGTLTRGYSLTTDGEGKVIKSVSQVTKEDVIKVRVTDGEFSASVI